MNKLLLTLALMSFSLNIYQYLNPAKQKSQSLDKIYETQDSSTVLSSALKSINNKNAKKIEITTMPASNNPLKVKVDEQDANFAFEKIKENTNNDVETFLMRDLNFNIEEVSSIFKIIKKSDKEFREHITKKQRKLEGLYNESYGYQYDPEDYILMGKKRLEARALIKNFIGDEKYKKFLIYVRDYNHGKYSESFVPIDF